MADIEKTISDLEEQISWIRDNEFHKFPGWGHAVLAMNDAIELLKEQQKKEIKLIKKHTFSLGRADEFSMRKLYEVICETLMDEGQLIISRTDDYEKVNFVWEIRPEET